jgi:hypothetical protein
MRNLILIVAMFSLSSEIFAKRRSYRSRSFFKAKRSKSLFKPTKKVNYKRFNKTTPKTTKRKTVVVNKTYVNNYNQGYSNDSGSLLGSVANAYMNYAILSMVLNPRTGKMECPNGSLLDTQRDVCVQQNQQVPMQRPISNVQSESRINRVTSDRIE